MERRNILSLLGLCLRGGHLAVGEEPVEAAVRSRDVRVLLTAADAAESTRRRCQSFAGLGECLWLTIPFTKEELGRALGRTCVAMAAVTDVGLAEALLRRLAELDPAQYREAAERMALKARRAAERRAEHAAQEKNARREKGRPAAPPQKERPSGGAAGPAKPKGAAAPAARPAGARPSRRDAAQPRRSRPPKSARPKPRAQTRFAHSRPVKKGKGSFRKKGEG